MLKWTSKRKFLKHYTCVHCSVRSDNDFIRCINVVIPTSGSVGEGEFVRGEGGVSDKTKEMFIR